MPGVHGDIDHVAISPTGIYVIDTKDVRGKVKIVRPLLGESKLLINGRDILSSSTASTARSRQSGPRSPALNTQKLRGHLLIYSRALAKRLNGAGPSAPVTLDDLARNLASALPPA